MKLVSISMAFMMLMAIVLRSLPDSVFNYFHSHSHGSSWHADLGSKDIVEDHKHNCHIEDWNFESFEVVDQQYRSMQPAFIQPYFAVNPAFTVNHSMAEQGRAPPVAS